MSIRTGAARQSVLLEIVNLAPPGADKHTRYRLAKFAHWLAVQGQPWHKPNLAAYRDHLLAGYAPRTVRAHLSTIRGCYARLVKDNAMRDVLYAVAAQVTDSPVERKAFVDETLTRIENAIDPQKAAVRVKVSQDQADADQLRLTAEQASALMAAPGLKDLAGLRDTAVIALMLCTGIREAELAALEVGDLRQRLGGELALHVREGKGCKERLIPYGELSWVLAIVNRWLVAAGIESGRGPSLPVFRGIHKGGERLRPGRLSVRAIQYILASYPVMVEGELVTIRPHDCRRTYARRLYEAGMDLVAIQQNLGHADVKTTLGYIGILDAARRRAPAIYTFDLSKLAEVPVQAGIEDV